MIDLLRLMLEIPQEDLRLVRQLIIQAKVALPPIAAQHSVNSIYLDVITLDRASLATAALLQALPESLSTEKAVLYLSHREFKTILTLLEHAAVSGETIAGQCQTLWEQLDIAELNFNSKYHD